MRGLINDGLRQIISFGIGALGPMAMGVHRLRIARASAEQERLRRRYRISAVTPIQSRPGSNGQKGKIAVTSGSTEEPKRVVYTERRLRSVKWAFSEMFMRCCRATGLRRTSLYVFSSFAADESLTGLLLEESGPAPYLAALQAPYRVQSDPAVQQLAAEYGPTAVRLWVLTLANPGVLYATNPSTLTTFFDELTARWTEHSRLVRDFCARPAGFSRTIHRLARRLASRGSRGRLEHVARSDTPQPIGIFAPSVDTVICWTGGYMQPFLDRLAVHLPRERYRLVPMYSMSTETIETVPHFAGERVAFLPLARGVVYEFLEDGAEDRPEHLRGIDALEVGRSYTMIVTDPYGLRRYQTADLFLCKGTVAGLPDLEFRRRRGLEYSFTGEKVTADQLTTVFARLRDQCPGLRRDDFLACVPSYPADASVPHYKLVLVRNGGDDTSLRDQDITSRFDDLMAGANPEYHGKRASGRLGPPRAVHATQAEFAARMGGRRHKASWESQFKFLPLYLETWESRATT
jgi:GH3 auxin-responsive promoter